jgi:hypothetical protein
LHNIQCSFFRTYGIMAVKRMYFLKSVEKFATIFVRDLGYIGVDRIFPHVCSRHKQASEYRRVYRAASAIYRGS